MVAVAHLINSCGENIVEINHKYERTESCEKVSGDRHEFLECQDLLENFYEQGTKFDQMSIIRFCSNYDTYDDLKQCLS